MTTSALKGDNNNNFKKKYRYLNIYKTRHSLDVLAGQRKRTNAAILSG